MWYVIVHVRILYGRKNVIFTHGSTADTAFIASYADAYVEHHGPTLFICSAVHKEFFERLVSHKHATMVFWPEKKCQRLRVAWTIISTFFSGKSILKYVDPSVFIIPAHIVLYPEINNLVSLRQEGNIEGISYMEGLRRVLSLPSTTERRNPQYSQADKDLMLSILGKTQAELDKIAIINPICYTAENISKNAWRAVASAITDEGFTVYFNSQGNISDENHWDSLIPSEYSSIKLPAYLCPLVGQNVGLVCARNSGGFNLLQSFLRPKKSLLILIHHSEISANKKRDVQKEVALWTLRHIIGYVSDHVVVLSMSDDAKVIRSKTKEALNSASDEDGGPSVSSYELIARQRPL